MRHGKVMGMAVAAGMRAVAAKGALAEDDKVIEIEGAVVSYREDVALRGVSLSVSRGSIVGIVGPNGAGKTTLLTLINGLGRIVKGKVRVLGHSLERGCPSGLRARIGYVPQIQNIDPRLPICARDVVMMGRYGHLGFFRRPKREDWELVDSLLERVKLSHLALRPIGHLSGGEQQRVAIARALAQEPEILLLDEPTASLDRQVKEEILDLVREFQDKGDHTTLMVTHELDMAARFCDWVVLMKSGRILAQGRPEDVLREELLDVVFENDRPHQYLMPLRRRVRSWN